MDHQRDLNSKAWEEPGSPRCPVRVFRCFLSHRPDDMQSKKSPVFLQVRYGINYKIERVWYYSKDLGKNSIGKFMSDAKKLLPNAASRRINATKISNHSARKTTITTLLDAKVDPLTVKQLSGHKKVDSLAMYQSASESQQFEMSRLLSDSTSSSTDIDFVNHGPSSSKNKNTGSHTVSRRAGVNEGSDELPVCIQNQLLQDWKPLSPFPNATLNNCTININISIHSPPKQKQRRVVIDDDSQEE